MKILSLFLLGATVAFGQPPVNIVRPRGVNAQTGTTYTYQTGDRFKLVTHSNGGAIAATLPQANSTTFFSGWFIDVQNRGAGTLTITPTSSTIDGASSLALTTNQGARIVSDGTNYFSQRGQGAGGSGLTTYKNAGSAVGSPRSTVNFATPVGATYAASDSGTQIDYTLTTDVTNPTIQAGGVLLATTTSASATVYTATMSPPLTAYTSGQVLNWKVSTSCTGGVATTINIDTLGAKSLKQADGTTDPAAAQCATGLLVPIWYDGSLFRIVVGSSSSASVSGPYLVISGTKYISPFMRTATVPPTLTFQNTQGSSAQTVNADGSVTFSSAPVAGDNLVMLGTTIGANTTLTVALNCNMWLLKVVTDTPRCGIGFYENSSHKIESILFYPGSSGAGGFVLGVDRWTNQTTYASSLAAATARNTMFQSTIWYFKIRKTGGNIYFSASNDGISYSQEVSEAQTVGFTTAPDRWGVILDPFQDQQTIYSQILSYLEN